MELDLEPLPPLHARHERRQFTHLDGAIRAYELDAYAERLRTKMQHTGKAAHYRKVFRLDGPIPDDDWYQLVVMFYRQNEMVAEYLHEGFQDEVAARNDWPEDVRTKLAPQPTHAHE